MDVLKSSKDVLESKLSRTEYELKENIEIKKVLEVTNVKQRKALEDVHRKMAQQEARRKRDRLALDCVRLGKLTPKRVVSNMRQIHSVI